jgi:hypothetical protein
VAAWPAELRVLLRRREGAAGSRLWIGCAGGKLWPDVSLPCLIPPMMSGILLPLSPTDALLLKLAYPAAASCAKAAAF